MMPLRMPWESDKAFARRLKAWEVKQNEITERIEARQQGKSNRTQSKAEGGLYSPESVAARQGTVQKGIDAGLTAAEGIAQAFGYDVDLNGSDAAPTGTPTVVSASTGTFGMDQQTLLILAAVAIGGVLLLARK